MTNLEWLTKEYKDIVIVSMSNGSSFAVDKNGNAYHCKDLSCDKCLFCSEVKSCPVLRREWLEMEHYSIPLITPVDTKVLVRDSKDTEWKNRYFAGFSENPLVSYKCFKDGKTSWTTTETCAWRYCKLASEEEEEIKE